MNNIDNFDFKVVVAPELYNQDIILKHLHENALRLNVSSKVVNQINIVVDEIFSNVVYYAFKDNNNSDKFFCFSYSFEEENRTIILEFKDNGNPFDPFEKDDPDIDASLNEREVGGLGIYIVKQIMDTYSYQRINNENIVTITKKY